MAQSSTDPAWRSAARSCACAMACGRIGRQAEPRKLGAKALPQTLFLAAAAKGRGSGELGHRVHELAPPTIAAIRRGAHTIQDRGKA